MNRLNVVAFLGVSGLDKDGRVQFAIKGSKFHKSLNANSNYKEVLYTTNARTGDLQIFHEQADHSNEVNNELGFSRTRLRCTGKDCDMRTGFWVRLEQRDTILEKMCLLCGAKHAPSMEEVKDA